MSDYFVVLSNLSSIPCVLYYAYMKKYYYSMQILLASSFSLLHHMINTNTYIIHDNGLFFLLDGVYSYLSIYIFSIYLLLLNHDKLIGEQSIVSTIILIFSYMGITSYIVIPCVIIITLFIFALNYNQMNKYNTNYLLIITILCIIELGFFFGAVNNNYNYNYYHSIHHLIVFNIPIFVDKAIVIST